MRTPILLCAALLLAAPASGREMVNLALEQGRTDDNRISSPVYELPAESLTVEPIVSRLPASHKIVRRLSGRIPEYTPAPSIDLGAMLTAALQGEGGAMGLRIASSTGGSAGGWTVGGTLDDLYLETKPVIFGPLLFYGYLQVTLSARRGEGEPRMLRYRLHNMYARFNGGFGVQDEAAEVVAQFLIESAQEIAARLNRDLVQAPPHPSVASRLALLTKVAGNENALRSIGLSGSPAAVPALLALLGREADENARVNLIDALANLGSAEAIEPLAARYEREDEDCRFFTLKAWDYIGGTAAAELAAAKGNRDEDNAARKLAARIGRP